MTRYLNHFFYLISLLVILVFFIIQIDKIGFNAESCISIIVLFTGMLYEFFTLKTSQPEDKNTEGFLSCLVVNLFFIQVFLFSLNGILQTGFKALFVIGIFLAFTGLIFRILSRKELKGLFSYSIETQEKHFLITKGIYSLVRHPSYLGSYLFSIGILFMFDSLISMLLILLYIPFGVIRIKKEENNLLLKFGKEYLEYKKDTPCIIPFENRIRYHKSLNQ